MALLSLPPCPDGADGAPAPAKKKRGKAELRAQLEGETDPYRLLELEELRWRATQDDVRKAYRRLVLLHHPDKLPPDASEDQRAVAFAEFNDPPNLALTTYFSA